MQCDLLLAPPPSYYMRMSQNAADHVEHVQHADSELFYRRCLSIFCAIVQITLTCIVYLCLLHLAFDHYSIINKACIITFGIEMVWINLYKLAKFVILY